LAASIWRRRQAVPAYELTVQDVIPTPYKEKSRPIRNRQNNHKKNADLKHYSHPMIVR
jgi:hypothetical protein